MVATVVVMVATATARGLLMPSLRLRLSPDMAMAATAVDTAAMAATGVAAMDTARGRLRLSLAMAMVDMAVDTAAMVDTVVGTVVVMVATATARGLLSLAMAMAATAGAMVAMAATATAGAMATGVSYHRRR